MQLSSGVILAGGASRRMGRDKAWIEFQGQPLIERVLERLRPVCLEFVIVTGNPGPYQKLQARVVGDMYPGKGSLGGIYSGLSAVRSDLAIVVACDMPFLNPRLLEYMLTLAKANDVVIPGVPTPRGVGHSSKGRADQSNKNLPTAKDSDMHPLHAIYSKRCIEPIKKRLEVDDLRMISFHPDVRVQVVTAAEVERFDPDHRSLFNVNSPTDLEAAESLAANERKTINDYS